MDAIAQAEARWGIRLKQASKSSDEWHGPCPLTPGCAVEDGFIVYERGNYYCRKCGKKGFVDELEKLDPVELRLRRLEIQQRETERRIKEHEQRLTLIEQMHRNTDHIRYHYNLDVVPGAREYWAGEGVWKETQDSYQLGYCGKCPTDSEGRASYTIPLFVNGQLENIRHRLIDAPNGDKYRPHMAGLGAQLFNVDILSHAPDWVILGEGEKKAIVASQWGFPTVSVCGARTWKREWLGLFDSTETVYVCLDPDAQESAENLAAKFGERARIMRLPVKLDDFFAKRGGNPDNLDWFMRRARPWRQPCANTRTR